MSEKAQLTYIYNLFRAGFEPFAVRKEMEDWEELDDVLRRFCRPAAFCLSIAVRSLGSLEASFSARCCEKRAASPANSVTVGGHS